MKLLRLPGALLLSTLLFLAGPLPTGAEPEPEKPPVVRRLDLDLLRLSPPIRKRLKLTPAQEQKLADLREQRTASARAVLTMQDRAPTNPAWKQIAAQARRDSLAVLTPAQRAELDRLETGAARFPFLGRATTALLLVAGLNGEQVARLKRLSDENWRTRPRVPRGAPITPQLRQAARARGARTTAAVRSLLTPAQRKQFDAALR